MPWLKSTTVIWPRMINRRPKEPRRYPRGTLGKGSREANRKIKAAASRVASVGIPSLLERAPPLERLQTGKFRLGPERPELAVGSTDHGTLGA